VYQSNEPTFEEPFAPWAEYAVLTEVDGVLRLEFRRISFDVQQLLRVYGESGMPYAADYAAKWKSV
jgi:hypothetical protein